MTDATYPRGVPVGDEIDLVALLQGLWAQKWLIALVTLVVTLGGVTYAYVSKPVYETRITVLPPKLSDIAGFNAARGAKSGLKPFSVDDIFDVFTRNLQAEESRRQFFKDVVLPALNEEQRSGSKNGLYKAFTQMLSVKAPKKNESGYIITVERHDPVQAAEWVKQYLDQVTQQSLDDVLQITQREAEVRGKQIQQEVKTLREFAKVRRNDRLVKLKEALAVAETVGLVSPPVISGQIAEQLSAFMNGNLMYMRGTKALRAEIGALEARTSDDPFIPSLRNLEEQYSFLAGIQVSPENVAVSRQDGAVITPDAPIKPKKALILVLGVVLGGMLGLFIALVRLIFNKYSAAAQTPQPRQAGVSRQVESHIDVGNSERHAYE